MPEYTLTEQFPRLIVSTSEIEVGFSCEDGRLMLLRRRDGLNLVDYGEPVATLDLELNDAGVWLAALAFPRYLTHRLVEHGHDLKLTIAIGLGALRLLDCYTISGSLLARRVVIENLSDDLLRLRSLRMLVPWVQVGVLQHCLFEAPGNSLRPGIPLSVASRSRRGAYSRRFLAPRIYQEDMFELAPTHGPGLLALHNRVSHDVLLCWYASEREPAYPEIEGNGHALTIGHHLQLAGWIGPGRVIDGGTQYVLLQQQGWRPALDTLRRAWAGWGPASGPPLVTWIRETPLYTLHPAQFGGFQGTRATLPRLRELGVGAICLLPTWRYANPSGEPWDGNLAHTGSPYAVSDLEQVDPALGSSADLHALVEDAHTLGLRVLLDLPVAGCAASSRVAEDHPDWLCRDEDGRVLPLHGWEGTCSFDLSLPDLQRYFRDWAAEQVQRYGVDGYRVGMVPGHPANWNPGLADRAGAGALQAVELLRDLQYDLKRIGPDLALICEASGPLYAACADACSDYMAHTMLYNLALGRINPSDLGAWLQDIAAIQPAERPRICFTESQDTNLVNPFADGMRGSRLSRVLLAGLIFAGFVPMLWAGQEQGQEPFIARLLQVRREQPALRVGRTLFSVGSNAPTVFALLRVFENDCLLCLLSLSPQRRTFELSLPAEVLPDEAERFGLRELITNMFWRERGRSSWSLADMASLQLSLDPFSAYCFAIRVLPTHAECSEELEIVAGGHVHDA